MIEDDVQYARLLGDYLKEYDLEITNYIDPYLGLSAGVEQYDLLILDLNLPGIDGLEVCKEVVIKHDIPIIISSARADLSDKVIGLQLGADDYLPKPYDPEEMYVRIISLLRRYKKINADALPTFRLTLDKEKENISLDNTLLYLTSAEYEVLKLLIEHRGVTVSKEQILYGSEVFENGSDASLAVIINRIRKKLLDKVTLKTIRGVGYRLLS
jgi:two-component system OmpR family response regulator